MPGYPQMFHLNHYLVESWLHTCRTFPFKRGHLFADQLLGTAAVWPFQHFPHWLHLLWGFMWSLGATGILPLTESSVQNLNACMTVSLGKLKIIPVKTKLGFSLRPGICSSCCSSGIIYGASVLSFLPRTCWARSSCRQSFSCWISCFQQLRAFSLQSRASFSDKNQQSTLKSREIETLMSVLSHHVDV